MAGVADYNTDPNLNTAINGIDIAELCAAGDLNDAIRQMMADIKSYINANPIPAPISLPLALASGGTGQTSATAARDALQALDVAYRQLPQSAKSSTFTLDLTQGSQHIYYTGGAATASVPANSTVAFPVGAIINIINDGSGALAIARSGGVSMKWAVTGANADRSLAVGGWAALLKVGTDSWFISGAGLS